MNTQPDFRELLESLEKNDVEYMIVGGYAVAFHGFPRFTKDIDIFFDSSKSNVGKIIQALVDFGFPEKELAKALFTEAGNVVTFGVEPVRVDLLNEIDGVEFPKAQKKRIRGQYGDIEVYFIGREDLLKNKKASKRPKDKLDAVELEELG